MSWSHYKPTISAADLLQAGACLEGVCVAVIKHKTLVIDTPTALALAGEDIQYVELASGSDGYGYGDGNSYGYGNGNGYGYGYGYGNGYGYGYGNGYGDGYGDGYGASYGGDGDGNGYVDGYGGYQSRPQLHF